MNRRTLFNIAANHLFFFANALAGLVAGPLLLAWLGPMGFGAWKASQRFFDIAISPDGGAVQALKWIVARQSAGTDRAGRQRAVGAAVVLWALWLPALLAVAAVLILALPALIAGLDAEQARIVREAGLILAANMLLAGLLNIPNAVLIGSQLGYAGMVLRTAILVLSTAAMVGAAMLGFGLAGLALVVLAATLLNGVLCWLIVRRRVSWWGVRRPERGDIKEAAAFSGWMLLWTYVQRLLLASEIVLFSIFAGAITVTAYVFTAYASQFALAATQLTASAITPALAMAQGARNGQEAKRLAASIRETTLAIATFCGCAILLFNPSFVALWAGEAQFLGAAANVLIVLLLVQLALLRSEIQIEEASLAMRRPALAGAAAMLAGLALGALAWTIWNRGEALLLGLFAGRSLGILLLARPGADTGYRPLQLLACAALLLVCSALGNMLHLDWAGLLLLAPPTLLGLLALIARIVPSTTTRDGIFLQLRARRI